MSIWNDLADTEYALHFMDIGGVRTRVLEAGHDRRAQGDCPLLFLHGSGGHLEAYSRNIPAHAEHMRVLAVDMIGHGYTDRPDHPYRLEDYITHLLNLLDALGLERVSISGESLGGWIAGRLAIQHPDRVERLILNTAAGLVAKREISERVTALSLEAAGNPTRENIRSRLEWLMHDPAQVTDDMVETRFRIYSQPGYVNAMRNILHMMDYDNRKAALFTQDELGRIAAPTLVLWTSDDPGSTPETGQTFANWIPGARLAVMENCGHWPQFEDPATFNQLQLAFLLDNADAATSAA